MLRRDKLSKNKHLCTNCQKILNKTPEILYVDQSRMLGYCSEKCILEFNAPLMESFENEEMDLREETGIPYTEDYKDLFLDEELLHKVLYRPHEVWKYKNLVGSEFYTHLYKFNDKNGKELHYIIIASYFDNSPSFIYFKSITQYPEFVEHYKVDKKLEASDLIKESTSKDDYEDLPGEEISIPEDVVEDIEMKKSEYLAKLLEARKEEDVPFEKFPEYDEFLPLVLDEPDEIYSQEDDHGDNVKVYIKSFKIKKNTFFYIAICIEIDIPEMENHKALLPVLGFPSQDSELYKEYAFGERLSQVTKN